MTSALRLFQAGVLVFWNIFVTKSWYPIIIVLKWFPLEFYHFWVKINVCLKVLYSFFRPNTWGPGMFRRPKNFWSRTKIILTLHFYGRFNKLKKYIGMKSCIKSHETVNFKSDYMKVLTLLWNIQRATSPRKSSQLYVQCNFTPFFYYFSATFGDFFF